MARRANGTWWTDTWWSHWNEREGKWRDWEWRDGEWRSREWRGKLPLIAIASGDGFDFECDPEEPRMGMMSAPHWDYLSEEDSPRGSGDDHPLIATPFHDGPYLEDDLQSTEMKMVSPAEMKMVSPPHSPRVGGDFHPAVHWTPHAYNSLQTLALVGKPASTGERTATRDSVAAWEVIKLLLYRYDRDDVDPKDGWVARIAADVAVPIWIRATIVGTSRGIQCASARNKLDNDQFGEAVKAWRKYFDEEMLSTKTKAQICDLKLSNQQARKRRRGAFHAFLKDTYGSKKLAFDLLRFDLAVVSSLLSNW